MRYSVAKNDSAILEKVSIFLRRVFAILETFPCLLNSDITPRFKKRVSDFKNVSEFHERIIALKKNILATLGVFSCFLDILLRISKTFCGSRNISESLDT